MELLSIAAGAAVRVAAAERRELDKSTGERDHGTAGRAHRLRQLIDSIIDDLTQANVDLRTVTLEEMKRLIREACESHRQRERWLVSVSRGVAA